MIPTVPDALALALALLEEQLDWFERLIEAPPEVYAAATAVLLFGLVVFGVIDASVPFIYF